MQKINRTKIREPEFELFASPLLPSSRRTHIARLSKRNLQLIKLPGLVFPSLASCRGNLVTLPHYSAGTMSSARSLLCSDGTPAFALFGFFILSSHTRTTHPAPGAEKSEIALKPVKTRYIWLHSLRPTASILSVIISSYVYCRDYARVLHIETRWLGGFYILLGFLVN
jgi:hypothetical protein